MPALAIGLGVSGLFGYFGARTQAGAARRAAELQRQQTLEGIGTLRERTQNANNVLAQYSQSAQNVLEPYQATGANALQGLGAEVLGAGAPLNRGFTNEDFIQDPGYQFRMAEGARGVEGSAAARGSILSGGTLKALERYRQGFASNEFQNAYNRFTDTQNRRFQQMYSLAGIGQSAASQQANLYGQTGSQIAGNIFGEGGAELNAQMGIGNALGAGEAARGSAYGNFLNQTGQNIGQAITLNRILRPPNNTQTFSY